jgi:uncharacterized LabA/DUF88 family protein
MTNKKEDFVPPRNKSDMTNHLKKLVKGKRVSVYIDSANLYFASSIAKIHIDFIHLSQWFRQNTKLTGINFYTAFDPEESKQLDFIEELRNEGYRLVTKPIKIFENSKKGNMDIELAVDCITQKDMYDVVILLSGDGDFSYLIQALDSIGKDTIILGIGGFTSYELHQEADNYFFLNRIYDVWSGGRNRKSKQTALPAKKIIIDQEQSDAIKHAKEEIKHVSKQAKPIQLEKNTKIRLEAHNKINKKPIQNSKSDNDISNLFNKLTNKTDSSKSLIESKSPINSKRLSSDPQIHMD